MSVCERRSPLFGVRCFAYRLRIRVWLWECMIPALMTVPALLVLQAGIAPSVVQAQTAIHRVSAQTVRGTHDTGLFEVKLSETVPVNLSFSQTGEVIEQLWLNDPSRVAVSFFGCLASATFGTSPCTGGQQGTQILHLSQLRHPLDFDENLTTRGDPILTLVTSGSSGYTIYQIKLKLGGESTPPYATIEVLPSAPPAPAQYQLVTREYQQEILRQLSQGLAIAEAQGLVDTASSAYESVRSAIALMQSGTTYAEAITQTNTPRQLVDRLRALAVTPSN